MLIGRVSKQWSIYPRSLFLMILSTCCEEKAGNFVYVWRQRQYWNIVVIFGFQHRPDRHSYMVLFHWLCGWSSASMSCEPALEKTFNTVLNFLTSETALFYIEYICPITYRNHMPEQTESMQFCNISVDVVYIYNMDRICWKLVKWTFHECGTK